MIGIGVNILPFISKVARAAADYYNRVIADSGVSESLDCVNQEMSNINEINLLDQASLVMIPSGYKEDVVYSQIPTNGNGDLTWTRGSDGFRTNASGLIQRVPWNLLFNTNTFSSWNLEGGALTSGFTAPDNTSTAYKYVQTTGGLYSGSATATSGVKTASIWLKSVSGTSITCSLGDGGGGNATAVTVTGDWQLFTATYTTATSRPSLYIYSISNASGIYVWHPQLVEGTTAQTYLPTTDRLNFPRLDYTYGSCPSVLLEPQRTNSIRNSSMVGAVAGTPGTLPTNWVNGQLAGLSRQIVGVGTENGLPYIDFRFFGTTNTADGIRIDLEGGTIIAAATGQTWAYSLYSKLISGTPPTTSFTFFERNSVGGGITSGNVAFAPTSTLTRFSATRTLSGGATVAFVQPSLNIATLISTAYDFTIRIAAPQMELGAYPTTYIPTTSATVTRIADSFSRNNIYTNGLITSSGGTWFVELRGNVQLIADNAPNGFWLGTSSTSPANNGTLYFRQGGGSQRTNIWKYESGTATQLYTTTTDTTKLAIKWNGTTADIFANGTKVISATAFTATNMEHLATTGVGRPFFIQQMDLFPTPLEDVDCEVMTGTGYDSYSTMATALGYTII